MAEKLVLRIVILTFVVVILIAVFYQRPEQKIKQLDYLPAQGFVGQADQGRRLFTEYCISCHGNQLEGSDTGPALLHAYYKPSHHGDISIYLAVNKGVKQHHWQFGDMPAIPELNAESAGHLVAFIRQQQQEKGFID